MRKTNYRKIIFALFLLIGSMGIFAQEAMASHLRGVSLGWRSTGVANEVEFTLTFSQRYTFDTTRVVLGQNISKGINFGDGTTGAATGPVTSINTVEDYYVAVLKVKKTYSTAASVYTAFYSENARLTNLKNRSNTVLRLETTVRPATGNSSPVTSLPVVQAVNLGSTATFTVPATDADGDTLRYRLSTGAEAGNANGLQPTGLSIDSITGVVTWNLSSIPTAPVAGDLWTAQFMIEDRDTAGNIKSKVPVDVILRLVQPVGTPPTLTVNPTGPLTVAPNTPVTFTVTGNDTDANSRVTLNSSGMPAGASMSPAIGAALMPPVSSTFSWTPTLAQGGTTGSQSYVINFTATDDHNQQVGKSITINVLSAGAPTATSQSITAEGGVPQTVVLEATDPNGSNLSFTITGNPTNGTAVLSGSPNCTVSGGASTCTQNVIYTATNGYTGADSFTYRATNGFQNSNPANVSANVVSNVAPVAQSQSVSTNEDNALNIALGATDGNNDPLTFTVTNPSHGVLSGTAPNLVYTPNADYNGTDSFTFKVNDGTVDSNTATVSITVNSVNDAPSATGDSYTTSEDTPLNVAAPGLLANDSDIDSSSMSAVIDTNPANGVLTLNPNGSFTYTPNQNFSGADSFTYHASDGAANSGTVTVSITVNAVNDAPALGAISANPAALGENSSTTLSGSFTDAEAGDAHTVVINWGDGTADTTLNLAAGVSNFTATHQYLDDNPTGTSSDVYTAQVTVTDNGGGSATGAAQVTVNNIAPGLDNGQVNLNLWTKEDFTANSGTWTVQPGGQTVVQSINGQPTVFYSNQDFSGRFEGKIKVTTTNDDDFIGFVLGFNQGEMVAGSGAADYLLIDWKKGDQLSGTVNAPKGIAVSRVTSRITTGNVNQFWGHIGAVQQLARGATLGNTGWVTNTEYSFTFEYDSNHLRILVNGVEQFNLTAPAGNPFPAGRLGFYNYSQEQVVYSSFADDSIVGSEVQAVSVSKNFNEIGTLDTHTATINWGDGSTSPATISAAQGGGTVTGSHVYADNGSYPVTITLSDDDGGTSSDALTATIANVSPTATFSSGGAVTFGQSGSVAFTNPSDPATADTAAGLRYAYDFDNNGTFEVGSGTYAGSGTAASAVVPASFLSSAGDKTIKGRIIDKDNGFTDYTTTITVGKANQTISFAPLADKTFGDPDFQISATATSNLPVSFAASGNCTVSGNTVRITGAGSCTITASQTGGTNYNAATDVAQTFSIAKATPTITWSNPADITYGTALSANQLNATASVPGTFAYLPAAGTILNAGNNQPLAVNLTPTDAANYNTASKTVAINVLRAAASISVTGGTFTFDNQPHPATGFAYGLGGTSDVLTPALTFSYLNVADNSVLTGEPVNPGIYKVSASFAGNQNYNPASAANAATVVIFSDACTTIPTGAVAWYQGENSGVDIVGGNNGTPTAGASFAAGEVNQGFLFNGTTSYVNVNNHPSLKMTTMMTVSAWINPAGNGSGGSGGGIIVNKEGEYEIARFGDGTIRWAFANTSPGWTWISTGYVAPLNQWTHIVVTYAPGGTIRTFANGVLVHTQNGSGNIGDNHTNADDLRIGGRMIPSSSAQNFNGKIDEVQIFNRNLTETEARAIYLADGRGVCAPAATTTTVQSLATDYSPNDQSITLNATVAAGNTSVNAGTVNFTVANGNGNVIGTAVSSNVSGGAASAAFTLPGGVSPQALTVTANYNNSGAAGFQFSTGTGTLTINKATPTVTWINPADITYGTALGTEQLNATASVPGDLAYTPAAGTILNAGNNQALSVNFTPSDSVNYNAAQASVSINVLQASLTVKADDKSRNYGDNPAAFTATPNGFVNGDTMASLGGALAFNFADAANKAAGTYTITPSGLTSNNYAITFQDGTLTVNKAALTVTADNASRTYGTQNPAFTASYAGFVLGENASVLGGALAFNTAADQTSPAGTYSVTPAGLTSGNYEISFVAGTLTVDKAALTVTTNDASKIYGDQPVSFTVSYGGFVNGDDASDLGGTLAFDFADTVSTAANNYHVSPSGLTSTNYNITFVWGTLMVSKAAITISVDDKSRVYGAANPAFTGTLSGVRNGDNITASYSSSAGVLSPAGSYAISPSLSDPDNKLVNYTSSSTDGTLTVTKATLSVVADSFTRTYGAANPTLTGTVTGVLNDDGITASYATAATAASAIGGYPITIAVNDSNNRLGNYNVSTTDGVLTVEKAALTVTSDSFTRSYGAANPVLTGTITGIQNGDAITASYATTADAASPVGTYSIVPTPAGATLSNYEVSLNNGTLTINQAALSVTADNANRLYGQANPTFTGVITGIQNGENITATYATTAVATSTVGDYAIVPTLSGATLSNYQTTVNNGVLTIEKAAFSITADNKSKTYGDALPALTGTVSGVQNGDNITASYSTAATSASGAGSYAITASAVDPDGKLGNYNVTLNDATLTVSTAVLTVTADNKSKTYGDAAVPFTATYTGLVNGDTQESLGGLAFNFADASTTPAGTHTITPSGVSSSNYEVTFQNGTLNVNQAALTVTADDKSKVYGQSNPALTVSYSGFVNGETPANLGGTLALATNATSESAAGNYPITATGLTSANYAITFVDGTLEITKAALSVTADNKSKTYGGAAVPFTVSYSGFVNGDDQSDLGGALAFNFADAATTSAGTHPITPSGLTSPNYAITFASGTLTVNKAALSVTADDKSRKYGELNPALTGVVTGILNGDNIAASYSTQAAPQSNVGAYSIVPALSGAALSNYNVTSTNGTLSVTKATPVINWNNPAAILVGTPLGATQLNASAAHPADGGPLSGLAVNGLFTYLPAAGTLLNPGNNPLSTVFTPADSVNYTTANKTVIQRVNYNVCAQYDQTKAHNSGSTIPVKLKLCTAAGVNLSANNVVVNAVGTRLISPTAWGEVEDSGNANPDNNFRYTDGMYMYNLQTKGLSTGVYQLGFIVGNDPTIYTVEFQIK